MIPKHEVEALAHAIKASESSQHDRNDLEGAVVDLRNGLRAVLRVWSRPDCKFCGGKGSRWSRMMHRNCDCNACGGTGKTDLRSDEVERREEGK